MLTEAMSAVLIARQFGRQIALDTIEKDISSGKIASSDDFVSYFLERGVRMTKKKISLEGLINRPYLFPCVATINGNQGIVVTAYSKESSLLTYVDPTNSSSGAQQIELAELREEWVGNIWLVALSDERESLARPFDWSWFLPELLRYRSTIIFIFILSLVLHTLSFTPILYLQISLDKVVGYGASATLNVLTIGVVAILLMNAVMTVGRDYAIRFIGQAIEARLLTDAFDKLLRLPAGVVYDSSEVAADRRVTGGSALRKFVTERLIANILDLSSLLIFVPILFLYSFKLGLLVTAFVIFQACLSLTVRRLENDKRAKVSSAESVAATTLRETIGGIDIVKALSLQSNQRKGWRSAASELIRMREERDWVSSIGAQSSTFVQQVMTVSILFFGINLVFGGELMAGALIAVNMVASRIINPVKVAVGLLSEFQRIESVKDEVAFIWNEKPERQGFGKEVRVRGAIAFKEVMINSSEAHAGLKNIILDIRPGERVALLGAADCGSDLIISCLIGNARPTKGVIEIDKSPLAQLSLEHYRNQVALLDANPRFFNGSIESNIRRANPNISDREFEDTLTLSGLNEVVEALPDGLNTRVNSTGSTLPSSHRLKLSLARGFAMNPGILLVSKGFDGMDRQSQLDFLLNIEQMIGNRTLVMATQQLSLTVRFDKIVVMDKGQIISEGKHRDLIKSCDLYAQLMNVERRVARELWAEAE